MYPITRTAQTEGAGLGGFSHPLDNLVHTFDFLYDRTHFRTRNAHKSVTFSKLSNTLPATLLKDCLHVCVQHPSPHTHTHTHPCINRRATHVTLNATSVAAHQRHLYGYFDKGGRACNTSLVPAAAFFYKLPVQELEGLARKRKKRHSVTAVQGTCNGQHDMNMVTVLHECNMKGVHFVLVLISSVHVVQSYGRNDDGNCESFGMVPDRCHNLTRIILPRPENMIAIGRPNYRRNRQAKYIEPYRWPERSQGAGKVSCHLLHAQTEQIPIVVTRWKKVWQSLIIPRNLAIAQHSPYKSLITAQIALYYRYATGSPLLSGYDFSIILTPHQEPSVQNWHMPLLRSGWGVTNMAGVSISCRWLNRQSAFDQ